MQYSRVVSTQNQKMKFALDFTALDFLVPVICQLVIVSLLRKTGAGG